MEYWKKSAAKGTGFAARGTGFEGNQPRKERALKEISRKRNLPMVMAFRHSVKRSNWLMQNRLVRVGDLEVWRE
jgi:hypothetical protein